MTAPLLDEVDTVMQNYFAALTSKDEDIFRLYEDNKRMRTLVQETLKAREDLEAHSRSQALLITSLKTELHEKNCLIEAQDDESSVLREGIAELRVLFGCRSELNFSPQDVISKVRDVVKRHDYLQAVLNRMSDHHERSHQAALQNLIDEEARARREVEGAAQFLYHSSIVWSYHQQAEAISCLEEELGQQRRAAEEVRADFSEQLQLCTQRLELETTRNARQAEGMSTQLASVKMHASIMQLELLEERERAAFALEGILGLVQDVWEPWCVVIERHRRQQTVKRQALERKTTELTAQLDSLQAKHASTTEALENLQHTHRRQQKHILKLEEKVGELDTCRNTLQEIRLKHEKVLERLRKVQQQYQAATQTAAETSREHEKQLEEATKKTDRLTQQNTFLYKDVKALEKRVEGLTKRAQTLEAQLQQLRKEKQVEACEAEAKVFAMEHEVQRARQEYEGRLAADKAVLQDHVKELEVEREDLKGRLDRSQSAHAEGKKRFVAEIAEWAGLAEALKAQLVEARTQLEKESTARKVLESSQRTESELLSKLIANSSTNTSLASPGRLVELTNGGSFLNQSSVNPAAPVLATRDGNEASGELTRALESEKVLRHQVQILEQSCRRSTAVISELREALYRERMERETPQR
ncbi:unnamed protein product [Phytomonas sp. EM1]|nr:unnamed protein product [Phytomonas sp. EM1]|eukprot:CCW62334.1 unnamed protein product [Phytomonas sp. isolate EM1]